MIPSKLIEGIETTKNIFWGVVKSVINKGTVIQWCLALHWRNFDRNHNCVESIVRLGGGEGLHSTEVAFLLLTQRPRVQFSAFPFAEINRRFWIEESGQRLENIDRTHLLLASGKLVLHKSIVRLVSRCWVWVRFLICSWPSPRASELG